MKKLSFVVLLLLIGGVFFAQTAKEFILGSFAFTGNKDWPFTYQDSINVKMANLGYNNAIIELFPESDLVQGIDGIVHTNDDDMRLMFQSLKDAYLKASIMDKAYLPTIPRSSYAFSTGCYQRFEAEFKDGNSVSGNDADSSRFWYGSRDVQGDTDEDGIMETYERVGSHYSEDIASYHNVWLCSADSSYAAGYAYGDLRYRWLTEQEGWDIRVGKEFDLKRIIPQDSIPSYDDRLHIRYALDLSGTAYDNCSLTDTLLTFTITGYPYSGGGHLAIPDSLNIIYLHRSGNEGTWVLTKEYHLTKADYENLPDNQETLLGKILDVEVSYRDLFQKSLLEVRRDWDYRLVNINPRVYWHKKCDLKLDYIEIYDQIYKNILDNSAAYTQAIRARIEELIDLSGNNLTNISHIFSFDEPYQTQFKAYNDMQNNILNTYPNIKQFTALNNRDHKTFRMQSTNKYYSTLEAFTQEAQPKYVMVNPYPIEPDLLWNSDTTNKRHIQNVLDNYVLDYYKEAKEYVMKPQVNGEFYAGVQCFGRRHNDQWESYLLPPAETQTMLQYLPLCYGADGIYNYRLLGLIAWLDNEGVDEYAPLTSNNQAMPEEYPITYNALKQANAKIKVYGNKICNLQWKGANTILENSVSTPVSLSLLHLDDIHSASTPINDYGCYVQSGYFLDDLGNPSLMLVNRRANRFVSSNYSPAEVPCSEIGNCFPPFNNQDISITIASSANAVYGDCVGFYDAFDESVYLSNNNEVIVTLRAGDGKHLQMCGTLPEIVTGDHTLSKIVVIDGEVELSAMGSVQIEANSQVKILPNTHITLHRGSEFTLKGTISIGDSVRFSIASDAIVNISEANCEFKGTIFIDGDGVFNVADSTNCTYLENSQAYVRSGAKMNFSGVHNLIKNVQIIASDQSELTFDNAVLNFGPNVRVKTNNSVLSFIHSSISQSANADSILVNNLSSITIQNSLIRKTPIYVSGSDLLMENSSIEVGFQRPGISVYNPFSNRSVLILGDQGRNQFTGTSHQGTRGIEVLISHAPIVIRDTDFNTLQYGIRKTTTTTVPDSVFDCSFENCATGIYETSIGACGRIENCSFTNTGNNSNIGIYLLGSIPTISQCVFNACGTGVYFEGSYYTPLESGIYNSVFQMCDTAIESRSANPRVQDCDFYLNDVGMKCHVDSNANLSYNASNCFRNTENNIQFLDPAEYHSYIQLTEGHNDFWHFGTPDQSFATIDFHFDDYYYSLGGSAIDVSKNWFEADSVLINLEDNPHYDAYVYYEDLDESPNTLGTDPDGSNRYMVALHQEAIGQFDQAAVLYQTILNEGLENEVDYFGGCVDGLYRVSCLQEMQAAILAEYLEQKITQFTPIDSSFCKLLSDYQIKAHVVSGDFQSAINLIQSRIEFPVNVIDSLRAVLDLEIVLQLESLKEAKKPIALKFTQYRYPNVQIFYQKHEEHLKELYKLMDKGNGETCIPIPAIPKITSNYPNPFNPSTTIEFGIPADGKVKLCIYNLKGQKVKELLNAPLERGYHKAVWDGKDKNNRSVSSGVYFVRLEAGKTIQTRKIMLMK
jgi:hypothetical protein